MMYEHAKKRYLERQEYLEKRRRQKNWGYLHAAIKKSGSYNKAAKILQSYAGFEKIHRGTISRWHKNPPIKLSLRQRRAITILLQHVESYSFHYSLLETAQQIEDTIKESEGWIKNVQDLTGKLRRIRDNIHKKISSEIANT